MPKNKDNKEPKNDNKKAFFDKVVKLEDIKPVEKDNGNHSNLIELKKADVSAIVELLRQGKAHHEIKKLFTKKVKNGPVTSMLSASIGQIKEIDEMWKAKIVELTPIIEPTTTEV